MQRGSSSRFFPLLLLAVSCALAEARSLESTTHKAPRIKAEAASIDVARGSTRRPRIVLHSGDSMVGGGLYHALKRRFARDEGAVVRDCNDSVRIKPFATSHHFREMLAQHDPDLVILTLGANDIWETPASVGKYIESIAKEATLAERRDPAAGPRACFWIGPPTWKRGLGDGVVKAIRDHAGACTFFDSSGMNDVEREPDRVHPTELGGAEWAIKFWEAYTGARASDMDRRVLLDVRHWR